MTVRGHLHRQSGTKRLLDNKASNDTATMEKEKRIHFLLPSEHGPMGLWMTHEDIATVLKMEKKYPGKYKGGEGVLQALIDSQK